MSCDNCHKTNLPLRKCAKCASVAYCSLECQRADWRAGHKNTCGKAATFQQLNASAKAGDKAEMMKLMSQLLSNRAAQEQAAGGGHGHSHGGKPCHGHGAEEPEEEEEHGHAHGGGGHGHGHGGPTQVAAAAQGHGHSHGGKPCHGHGAEPTPAPAPQAHGHSHGGKPCHGHGAESESEPADHGHEDAGDTHHHGYARQRARLAEKAKKQAHGGGDGGRGHGHSHGGQPCHGHGGADSDDETETTLEFFHEELEKQKLYQPLIHCEQKGNTTSDVPSYPRPTLTPVTVDATSPFTAALSELQVASTHFSADTNTPTIYHLTYPSTSATVSLIPPRQTFLRLVPDVPLNDMHKDKDEETSPLDVEGMNAHIRQGPCHLCEFQSAPIQMRQGISQHMASSQHIIRTFQTRMTSGTPAVVMEMHTYQMPINTLIPSVEALLPKVEESKQEGAESVVEGTMSKSALKKKKQKAKARAAADSDKAATTSTPEPSSTAPSITKTPKKKKKEVTVIQLIARIPGVPNYYAYEFVSTTDRLRTPLSLFHTIFDFTLSHLITQHHINITSSSHIHVFTDRTEWSGIVSTNTMKFIELEVGRSRTLGSSPADLDQLRRNLIQKYHDSLKKEHAMSNVVLKQLHSSWSLSSLSTFILPYGHPQEIYRSWASIPAHEIQRYLVI